MHIDSHPISYKIEINRKQIKVNAPNPTHTSLFSSSSFFFEEDEEEEEEEEEDKFLHDCTVHFLARKQ
jgi:hypothetical protein